jgi:hypothetical protein
MIVINAILESFRSLKDKTIKLSFETQEPTPEQLQEIAVNNQKYGYLVFSGNQLSDDQLEAVDKSRNDLYDSQKSPSKRLRNVLFRWYEQDSKGFNTFEDYYLYQMERIITNVKDKLE